MTKVHENRLRRWASRLGVTLQKSRAKRWSIDDRGGYRIIDAESEAALAGERFDLDLDDVEEWLTVYEARLREGGDDE